MAIEVVVSDEAIEAVSPKLIKVPDGFEVAITLKAAPDTWIAVIRRKSIKSKKPISRKKRVREFEKRVREWGVGR